VAHVARMGDIPEELEMFERHTPGSIISQDDIFE
jgi:hypothetical protein